MPNAGSAVYVNVTVSLRFYRLGQYTISFGLRAYCYAELTITFPAMAITTISPFVTIPRRVENWVDLVVLALYHRQSPIQALTAPAVE